MEEQMHECMENTGMTEDWERQCKMYNVECTMNKNGETTEEQKIGNQRVFEFLLRIKHLPTAVYINESGASGT